MIQGGVAGEFQPGVRLPSAQGSVDFISPGISQLAEEENSNVAGEAGAAPATTSLGATRYRTRVYSNRQIFTRALSHNRTPDGH